MVSVLGIVSYPFLPAKTGGQKNVHLFYKYLSRWTPVTVVATVNNDLGAAAGYKVLPVLSTSPLRYINPANIFRLRKIIRQEKATHIVFEHPYLGWLGFILKHLCGVKLVLRSHNIEGLRWKSLGKWWWKGLWIYEKYTHRNADYNLFITPEDMRYALEHWKLAPARCTVFSYGFERETIPPADERAAAREKLHTRHDIPADTSILLFNGIFNYRPNLEALKYILDNIDPLLKNSPGFRYRIVICGKDIPEDLDNTRYPGVVFAGFVDDIDTYLMGADVFLNPIIEGGGIKTKLVEALGNNLSAVSVRNGAIGVDPALCGGKLLIAENADWTSFADLVVTAASQKLDTPPEWFTHFYWGYSTRHVAEFISK